MIFLVANDNERKWKDKIKNSIEDEESLHGKQSEFGEFRQNLLRLLMVRCHDSTLFFSLMATGERANL